MVYLSPYPDSEKNRYFRIQANHQVPRSSNTQPSSSSSTGGGGGNGRGRGSSAARGGIYSHDEVKKRKREEELHQKQTHLKARQAKETIKQSPLLKHPLTEVSLSKEVSAFPAARISASSALPGVNADMSRGAGSGGNAALVEERGVAVASQMERRVLVKARYEERDCTVTCFARDWRTGELFVGTDGAAGVDLLGFHRSRDRDDPRGPWTYYNEQTEVSHGPCPQGVATPILPGFPGEIYHCSSPRPNTSDRDTCFAIGSPRGLLTITPFNASSSCGKYTAINKEADVKAVDWLSENVIVAGTRASQVLLYDMRSDGSTVRVQHPHGVHSIKKVDEWRIAVAGWGNNLSIYDLRHTPAYTSTQQSHPDNDNTGTTRKTTYKRTNNPRSKYTHPFTKPYLPFPEYHSGDESGRPCNIDISPELGLLATSSESNSIDLFSIRTGSRITLPPQNMRGKGNPSIMEYAYPSDQRIRQVQFEYGGSGSGGDKREDDDDDDDPRAPRVLVAYGNVVEEWAW